MLVVIEGENGSQFRLWAIGEPDDELWHACQAEVRSGSFSGSADLSLLSDELELLMQQLGDLESQRSMAFQSTEEQLSLRIEARPPGTLLVRGELGDLGRANVLSFAFESHLTRIVARR